MMPDLRPRLLRQIIIDVLPYSVEDADIQALQDRLGLVPSSLDVLEAERRESDDRIMSMGPISDALNEISGYSAEAIAEYFLMHIVSASPDTDLPVDNIRKVLVNQNHQVITTSVHAIVSHLISSGVLEFGKGLDK